MTILRTLLGDPVSLIPESCQSQTVCIYTGLNRLIKIAAEASFLYYALATLAFPRFKLSVIRYPEVSIKRNLTPKRFWAIPLLGGVVKVITLIPIAIALFVIYMVMCTLLIINSFVVLFTGEIWYPAYKFVLWETTFTLNTQAYWFGLTDKYPSFGNKIQDPRITFSYIKPQKSSRLFAVPVIGFIIRYLLLLPFLIYVNFTSLATIIGVLIASVLVLFTKKYPESVHELTVDSLRLQAALRVYTYGMSDKYPSFDISLRHPVKKAILIGFVVIASLLIGK